MQNCKDFSKSFDAIFFPYYLLLWGLFPIFASVVVRLSSYLLNFSDELVPQTRLTSKSKCTLKLCLAQTSP